MDRGHRVPRLSVLLARWRIITCVFKTSSRQLLPTAVASIGLAYPTDQLKHHRSEGRRSSWTQARQMESAVQRGFQPPCEVGIPGLWHFSSDPEQQAQRCSTGRLIGGLGGGAGAYAMSRNEGRAWAIPLGALLGFQVWCNVSTGRGPLPR